MNNYAGITCPALEFLLGCGLHAGEYHSVLFLENKLPNASHQMSMEDNIACPTVS